MAEEPGEGRPGQRDWGGNTASLGGYGSAGLFSRRRQMERTTGGSFLNLSDAPRVGATGGYVGMPTTGPSPIVRGVEYAPSQPASGPKAMAQFVAPNFNRAGPKEVVPTGATERALTRLSALAPFARPATEEPTTEEAAEEAPEPPPTRPQLALPSAGRPMGTGEEDPRALEAGFVPFGALPRGGRAKRRNQLAIVEQPTGPTWDPTMVAPIRMAGIGALAELPPAFEGPRPVSTPPPGAIFAASRRRGRSTVGTESEPREMSQAFEFGNEYLGQNPGRRATRGTRKAYKDPNQGQILGNDWEAY